jgi:predicted nuclease of predicted toxin-antitoxin system
MRLLLDESVNFRLNRHLPGHDVLTTKQMGWDSYHNGELLTLARGRFDVLITRDQKMEYQQNISQADVAIVVLHAKSNAIRDLEPMAADILGTVPSLNRGQIEHIYPTDPP